jgi:hypothetical protein
MPTLSNESRYTTEHLFVVVDFGYRSLTGT